jgi:hypothetical protein
MERSQLPAKVADGLEGLVEFSFRIVPESIKDFVALRATPRVVERERSLAAAVETGLNLFCAKIETEIRLADGRMRGVLDSADVREAISDLRARSFHLALAYERTSVGVEALLDFIALATDLGTGGIKAATNPDEIADAASRAVDHVEGYMVSHGHIADEVPLRRPKTNDVRKKRTAVMVREVAAWDPGSIEFVAVTLRQSHDHATSA